jgi:hypothetical protein
LRCCSRRRRLEASACSVVMAIAQASRLLIVAFAFLSGASAHRGRGALGWTKRTAR